MLRAALAQGTRLGSAVLSPVPMGQIPSYSHMQELRDLELILLNIYEEEHVRARQRKVTGHTQYRAGKERASSSELKESLWTKGLWFYGNLAEAGLVNCGKLVYSGPSHQAQMMQGMRPLVGKISVHILL